VPHDLASSSITRISCPRPTSLGIGSLLKLPRVRNVRNGSKAVIALATVERPLLRGLQTFRAISRTAVSDPSQTKRRLIPYEPSSGTSRIPSRLYRRTAPVGLSVWTFRSTCFAPRRRNSRNAVLNSASAVPRRRASGWTTKSLTKALVQHCATPTMFCRSSTARKQSLWQTRRHLEVVATTLRTLQRARHLLRIRPQAGGGPLAHRPL
jgi:hypothetical protein